MAVAFLLAACLASEVPALAQGAAAPRTVKVSRGDTLDGIAKRYGVSVADLQRLNGLKDADLLQVGQTLRLPAPPRKGVVVVASGDTLESIAKAHRTTVAALQKANPGIQPDKLKVGSTLRLAPAANLPASAAKTGAPTSSTPLPPTVAPKATTAPSAPASPPQPLEPPAALEKNDPSSRGRWRYFGDTVVDWGGWKRQPDGVRYTLVQPAPADVGESRAMATAIAVDCGTLRHTWLVKDAWESWSKPAPRSVGQQIVLELCRNSSGNDRRPVPAPPSPAP